MPARSRRPRAVLASVKVEVELVELIEDRLALQISELVVEPIGLRFVLSHPSTGQRLVGSRRIAADEWRCLGEVAAA
ncbi:MAG: hypothetical protein AB7S98_00265 [Burkholderiaceae bacterium]